MDSKAIAASLFRENLLPVTFHDTPVQKPASSPLQGVTVTESTGFVSLVDALYRSYSARAPRIPMIRRDYIITGP